MEDNNLGIDATNIRSGGGLTHLISLLNHIEPDQIKFNKIILFSSSYVLNRSPQKDWLEKIEIPINEANLITRSIWQKISMVKYFEQSNCSLIFSPGGIVCQNKIPTITMCRNMLPFEWNELKRFGFSIKTIRYILLYFVQLKSFKSSAGIIFISEYAKNIISPKLNDNINYSIIHHGIANEFYMEPKKQIKIEDYDEENPYCISYVSIINLYKHQWNVVEAIYNLRMEGYPLILKLIGPRYKPAFKKLNRCLQKFDPERIFVEYINELTHDELENEYKKTDAFVYASSCENLPNILLEAMAAGLPIASSKRGPMPEVLKDGGVYFDPENVKDIENSIKELLNKKKLREVISKRAHKYAKKYSWEICFNKTFSFLEKV
jgi:glycosyltransferase involved in cell wall biosynthesis